MAEEKKIPQIDDDIGKHPDRFYNIKGLLEKEAGFKEKPPESLEDKLKLFEYYHHPEHKFQERFMKDLGAIVRGGHPTKEKGAKYYALNSLYKILGRDTDKLEREEDIRKVLGPFMDEFLKHTTYEHWKELEEDLKKGKSDGTLYTEEEIFKFKAALFDRMIAAGADKGKGQRIMSIQALANTLKGKQRVEVESYLDTLSEDTITGYSMHTQQRIMDHYFRLEDAPKIKKYFIKQLEERNLQPKETIAHLGHTDLLSKYGRLLGKEAEEEYLPLKKE
ncbi:hypothetical protein AYK26_00930 [Euryarchaeota archaeon SM23-78]|nr:MAG: hypothetical protein AYK26_00930 [Euryarchaeota archaeon SM23-78]